MNLNEKQKTTDNKAMILIPSVDINSKKDIADNMMIESPTHVHAISMFNQYKTITMSKSSGTAYEQNIYLEEDEEESPTKLINST